MASKKHQMASPHNVL